MSVFCLVGSTARAHKKALFGNKGSRAIAAVEREERSTPRFFCGEAVKKCAKMINLTEKK
jgi:hypothetical protein